MEDIENLVDAFAMQKILADNFVVNGSDVTVDATTFQVPDSCFDIAAGKHFEFFLTLTSDPSIGGAAAEIIEVNLISGAEIVAQSSYSGDDADLIIRHYDLFYKGENTTASPQSFEVQIKTAGATGAIIAGLNLQYGVKVYEDMYPLTESTLPTC